jgi:hypothetical protein
LLCRVLDKLEVGIWKKRDLIQGGQERSTQITTFEGIIK